MIFRSLFLKTISIAFMSVAITACNGTSESTTTEIPQTQVQGILGGTVVPTDDPLAKAVVQILSYREMEQRGQQTGTQMISACTGTLIAKNIVLTAAHCVNPSTQKVVVYFSNQVPSSLETFLRDPVAFAKARAVVRIVAHQDYQRRDPNSFEKGWGDLALLKIASEAPGGIEPLRLIPPKEPVIESESLTAVGFGIINAEKKTDAKLLGAVAIPINKLNYRTGEFLLNTSGTRGICQGDSGGPVMALRHGHMFVAGVISRPEVPFSPVRFCKGRTVITDVIAHGTWIAQNATQLQSETARGFIYR